jgi:hypothetical protein
MSIPLWVVEMAESFWGLVGEPEPFPRTLRRAIARSLPVSVVHLPQLSVRSAEEWLRQQGAEHVVDVHDRSLRACLVSRNGQGVIFIDGTDPDNEQRFSIAHELAHFLLDYLSPRQHVMQQLGEGVLDVLDGLRPTTVEERAAGLLARVPLQAHTHLMDRNYDQSSQMTVADSERAADHLALELLAPWKTVSDETQRLGISQHRHAVSEFLERRFGLPVLPAVMYSELLAPKRSTPSSFLQHLQQCIGPVELSRDHPE